MSAEDRRHWDRRYAGRQIAPPDRFPPPLLEPFSGLFPRSGPALEVACGCGGAAVWLAERGMTVDAVDVSPVAIGLARRFADSAGVADRCRFEVWDLDNGLPEGPPVDLILGHLFRDPDLDTAMLERLAPNGRLAMAVLSEVDSAPGRYRSKPGELSRAFSDLETLEAGEANGLAWFIGRKTA